MENRSFGRLLYLRKKVYRLLKRNVLSNKVIHDDTNVEPITPNKVAQALFLLTNADFAYRVKIKQYEAEPDCPNSDEEKDILPSIFDKVYR